jgi:hypothetical protein
MRRRKKWMAVLGVFDGARWNVGKSMAGKVVQREYPGIECARHDNQQAIAWNEFNSKLAIGAGGRSSRATP